MIVLGLLLILLAVGAAAVAVTGPSATARVIEMNAVGLTVKASPLAMFLAGAVSVLMFGFGFALVSGGTRRKARARKELHGLRKDQATAAEASAAADEGRRAARVRATTPGRPPPRPAKTKAPRSSAGDGRLWPPP